jgi:hypothetical protein
LIDGSVNQAKIVQDAAGLRTFAGPEKSWHGNRRKYCDDRDYDHNFHEGEAPAAFVDFV